MQRILSFFPALAWFINDCILFTLPASAFPEQKWYSKIPLFDKWVHIGLLSILVTLIYFGLTYENFEDKVLKKYILWVAGICVFYGIAIEFIQLFFIPNRSFDLGDVVADCVGIVVGYFFSRNFVRRSIKK